MDYTVHGIFQARILEWVAFPFSRGYFQPRARTQVSCIARQILYQLSQKGRQTQKPFRRHLITSRWERISQIKKIKAQQHKRLKCGHIKIQTFCNQKSLYCQNGQTPNSQNILASQNSNKIKS